MRDRERDWERKGGGERESERETDSNRESVRERKKTESGRPDREKGGDVRKRNTEHIHFPIDLYAP